MPAPREDRQERSVRTRSVNRTIAVSSGVIMLETAGRSEPATAPVTSLARGVGGCRVSYPAVVGVCGACGASYSGSPKYCSECAAPLRVTRIASEERKVVTALFCDLVGFTALSESADPEDVDRMLTGYFAMARSAIEAFGGVVEKFIGDAVVGVFGVPAAHEDDPERAVRAGLRIAEGAEWLTSLDGGPLRLRVGINTGETLVRLGVVPGSGERFLAGDAINTASRIQSVAPLMGVAVGLSTFEATQGVFEYVELPPATLKGKSEPVAVFHAVKPRARLGTDVTRGHDGPFVGRELDLTLLKGVFDKTVAASVVQLVTIVGEPGLGKSRLVAELGHHVDSKPELITWRQGRCLPYGEGITFWALSEVVKAHAGILDSDDADVAADKLGPVLPDEQRAWYRQRLLPLVGVAASPTAEREELFAAWTGFLEHMAEDGPTVIVFEDLHWADEPMLDFLEHVTNHATGVPLLLIGTARPELFERRVGYGSGLRNATNITLAPLSDGETSQLVAGLLDAAEVPAGVQDGLLERAGGNPLFAEEYLRLLRDRGLLVRTGTSWTFTPDSDVPMPSTVQALLAARLDSLTPDTKALVADAAVVGKVFWDGALATMSGTSPEAVTAAMRELTRKQLVRPSRHSSIADQDEYAFWHVLTRDVAYAQLPRAARASRHMAAAQWIEQHATERLGDVADVLAHHYETALELAVATGDGDMTARARPEAARFLLLAGQRAGNFDAPTAMHRVQKALDLMTADDALRLPALVALGRVALYAGDLVLGVETLEAALLQTGSDVDASVDALDALAKTRRRRLDPDWTKPGDQMLALVENLPPAPVHMRVYTHVAGREMIVGHPQAAIEYADRGLALADQLGIDAPPELLGFRAAARSADLSDPTWVDDYRAAITAGTAAGLGFEVLVMYAGLALSMSSTHPPAAALEVYREGIAFAERRGYGDQDYLEVGVLNPLLSLGRVDEVLHTATALAPKLTAADAKQPLLHLRLVQTRGLVIQGRAAQARSWLPWLVDTAREAGATEYGVESLGAAALAHEALGEHDRAEMLFTEMVDSPEFWTEEWPYAQTPSCVRAMINLGRLDLARRQAARVTGADTRSAHTRVHVGAVIAEAEGRYDEALVGYETAATRWNGFTEVTEGAFATVGHGRCLVALGRDAEAVPVLARAVELLDRMGAAPTLGEIRQLLGGPSG